MEAATPLRHAHVGIFGDRLVVDGLVTMLHARMPVVKTFVVGFGSAVDATQLRDMARAGGTARAGMTPEYYQADDAASLRTAFAAIAGSVISCTYTLSNTPPDPDTVWAMDWGAK